MVTRSSFRPGEPLGNIWPDMKLKARALIYILDTYKWCVEEVAFASADAATEPLYLVLSYGARGLSISFIRK